MEGKQRIIGPWGVLAILTGVAGLALIYTGLAAPGGFYVLVISVLLAVSQWGTWGLVGTTLLLILSVSPALFGHPAQLPHGLFALFLALAAGLPQRYLISGRRRQERLAAGLGAFEEQLIGFATIPAVWKALLSELMRILPAEGGVWIWQQPTPELQSAGALQLTEATRQALLALPCPSKPQAFVGESAWKGLGFRHTLVLPVSASPWEGTLILGRARSRFLPAEVTLAQALTDMARQAVLGRVSYEQAEAAAHRRLQELELLQQMSRLVGESLDLNQTLRAVLETLKPLVPYDLGEITLWDAEQELLVSAAAAREDDTTRRYQQLAGGGYHLDEGLSGWLARHQQPILAADIREFKEARPKLDLPDIHMRAFLGIPLLARGELVGTLELAAFTEGRFSEHDLELVQALGAQAAVAIENARLFLASQERVQTLEQLRDMATAMGHAGDSTTLVQEIVTRVARLLKTKMAGILLYNADRRLLVAWPPFHGLPAEWVDHYQFPLMPGGALEQVFQHAPYLLIEDAQSDPQVEALGLSSLAVAAGVQQTLLVPLEATGERIGFLQVANPEGGHRFSTDDIRLLTMVATQISGMVRTSRLLEQVEHRAQQMSALVTVAAAIGGSLELETVLQSIARAVTSVLNCQRAAIFVLDPTTQLLNLAAGEGISQRYFEISRDIPVELGGRAHAVAANEIVLSADVLADEKVAAIAPLANAEGFRAFADLPLRRSEKPVGLLSVQFVEPHHFTQDEVDLLRILAEEAAVAIENARLYTQTDAALHRRVKALESLQNVTLEIKKTRNLDYLMRVVMQEALQFSQAEAGLAALKVGDQRFVLKAAQGYTDEAVASLLEQLSHPETHPFSQELLQQSEVVYFSELPENATDNPAGLNAGTFLFAPVLYEEQLAAVLILQSHRPQAFDPAVVEFVASLAGQAAFAIGNSRQYEEQVARGELMRQRAEQMALLLEVTHTMRSDRPLEDVLLDVSYAIQEATGYEVVLVSVLEGDALRRVAGAGIPLADLERMKRIRQPWSRIKPLLQEQFRIGRCYYVPAEYDQVRRGLDVFSPVSPDVVREPGRWHPLDILIVPLRTIQEEIIGIMSVDVPRDGRAPTAMSLEVLELFAAQVALAIENSHLVENLRLQLNTVSLFNELSRSVTTKLDLRLVLSTVTQSVTKLLRYDYATVFLQDKESRRFVPSAASGYALELLGQYSYAAGEGLVGAVAQTGMPLVLEDVRADARFVPGPVPIGATLLVPLTQGGRTIGVLTADRVEAGKFSPTEVATLMALADQITVAVQNAQLFEEVTRFSQELEQRVAARTRELAETLEQLRRERDRTTVLYRIASELVSSLDIDRVLDKALSLLRDAVQAEKGSILLLDVNTNRLVYRASIGRKKPLAPGGVPTQFSLGEGLVGWILSHRQAVIIPDTGQDSRWVPDEGGTTRSVLAVPILGTGGEPLGAIFLQSSQTNAFADFDLKLVEAAATQLGNALNNAELYRLIREQAERLGSMLRSQQIESTKNQAILESIADGVMVADNNGRVILFNTAAEGIFSISRSQALGRFVDEILGLYGAKAREWLATIQQWRTSTKSFEKGQFFSDRLEVGRQVVSVHFSPVISASREFLGVVSVFRDVTAEVEADRAKSEFVSTVSHELRTPMTSVKGYADLLLMGAAGSLSEMQRNFLTTIKNNADRLTALVNDLLDISRIETGRIQLEFKAIAIEPLIQQVVTTLFPKAREKDIQLRFIVSPPLPKVWADPDRLIQVVTNLAGNAYKYTPTGGQVSLYAYVRKGIMHVAVADTGIGISPENQKKIFERFYRVDDPLVQEVSGTGLGLAIAGSLAQAMGGQIWVESEPGEGSIFTFTVPLADGEPTEDVGEAPAAFAVTGATVLVVEDEHDIAEMIRLTLEGQGRRVLVASNGEEALRLARERHPDLISLDIRLPDLDGFEVLQLLKRDVETADIPVVVVSVVPDSERGLRLGAVDYLSKPINEQQLQQTIDRWLTQKGLVLVVEHDRPTLNLLRETLRAQGLNVRATTHGERVMRLARNLRPALIMLDLALADFDGYQLIEELRYDPQTVDIPVIAMTAQVTDGNGRVQRLEALGALRLLPKPFSGAEIAQAISELMNGKEKIRSQS